MEVFPVRTEPRRTWEVWSVDSRYAVVEFDDGRIVCISHDTNCIHVAAVRQHERTHG